jgi:hypothetical protein
MKKIISYFLIHFLVALIVSFLISLLIFNWNSIRHNKNYLPSLSLLFWTSILFLTIFYLLKRRNIDFDKFLKFFSMFFAWLILAWIVGSLFGLLSFSNFSKPNYIGLEGQTFYSDDEGNDKTSSKPQFIFKADDTRIKSMKKQLLDDYEEVSEMPFIFWQTAYTSGYSNEYVPNHQESENLERFITMGLLSIMECLFKSILIPLLYLVIPLCYLIFKKPLFFKDYLEFKKAVTK